MLLLPRHGGLSLFDEFPAAPRRLREANRGGAVVAPWTFSYITLAVTLTPTLTQKLKRHTIAPRGSRIPYENALKGAMVALGSCRIGEGSAKAPRRLREGSTKAPRRLREATVVVPEYP